jgi:hypothetical protein
MPLRPTRGLDQMKVTERIKAVCSCFCKRAPCKFCHLSCSSPISDSERPDSQAKSARQAGAHFSLSLTAPHSSKHKDSQMLSSVSQKCNLNIIFHEDKVHFATGQRALFVSSKNLGGPLPPCPPPPIPTPLHGTIKTN